MGKHEISIPKAGGVALSLTLETGHSTVIIGANGSGKTRLAVYLEAQIPTKSVQRIAAQKSLVLNHAVQIVSQERAENALRYGVHDGNEAHKSGNRWGSKPAVHPLNDFDALLQRLFAEHNRTAIDFLAKAEKDRSAPVPISRLRQLKAIWDELLPHRVLILREAGIEVMPKPQQPDSESYPGSDMSDGERAIFYFLGQCLVASADSAIIIDEPEGHVHKAILGPLWDAIEKARPDCAFGYITHDVDFAVTRPAAAKYYIRSYIHDPQAWEIAELPKGTGLPEDVVAEIVGSRRPILFVEGERGSLDVTFYRHQYADFTVVPIGGCDVVIRSVATYKNSGALHWLDAKGLVDADHRSPESIAELREKLVYVLPVAEVENLLLLPDVFSAVAEAMALDPTECLTKLKEKVLKTAKDQTDDVSIRYTSRRLDERLKRLAHAATDLASLEASYKKELAGVDPATMYREFKELFEKAIADDDLELVLKLFDNKTLPSIAASVLNLRDNTQKLMERIERLLGDKDKGTKLRAALAKYLPAVPGPTSGVAAKTVGVQHVTGGVAAKEASAQVEPVQP
jgi:energy-coupling factor transporter ATP-binding protein EcfA2